MTVRYDFEISGLLLRVESEKQLQIPDNFQPFYTDHPPTHTPDILIQIIFEAACSTSCSNVGKLSGVTSRNEFPVFRKYHWRDGEYIVRQESAGGGQPCRLFLPESFAEVFCSRGKWLNYLALERLLLPFDRIILHASAVIWQGKAYLFSAPSGGGKSTHAALWQANFGAVLLNGDKVVIHPGPDGPVAYGSPVAGSSGIYCRDSAPIAAVFLLHKAPCNRITPVSARRALLSLYSEAVKCDGDPTFNARVLDLAARLQTQIPVFSLECLPEKSAVDCILQHMEGIKR